MRERSSTPEGEEGLRHALNEVLEANRALRAVLQESEARTRRYIDRLAAGDRVLDLVRAQPVDRVRTEDNQAIERFTRARQRSRAATFRRLSEEGMSRREIADLWGFSQQMVSRIVNLKDGAAEE